LPESALIFNAVPAQTGEMSRWIGFSEDDGDSLVEGANIRWQSRVVLATR
jgi:hypothetical protein